MKWAAPSSPSFVGCGLYATNVSVSFTQNATSKIPFAAEDFDTDAFHDNSTNNTRITIPSGRGGKYLLTAFLRCTPANYGQLSILKNNAGIVNGINGPWVEQAGIGSYTTTFSNSIIVDAVATDYYEISFQSDWATGSKSIWSYFQAQYLGA